MANANVTMRMDEELKRQLQELVSNLGMDMTTFFTITAKQAVREQRIPFFISMDVPNTESREGTDKIDLKKYMGRGKKMFDTDAGDYVKELRENDRI